MQSWPDAASKRKLEMRSVDFQISTRSVTPPSGTDKPLGLLMKQNRLVSTDGLKQHLR